MIRVDQGLGKLVPYNVLFSIRQAHFSYLISKKGYTCQLFLRYKREIFILGVLGFLKTTRSFPKIPEEVRSLPKKSEVFRRSPKSSGDVRRRPKS